MRDLTTCYVIEFPQERVRRASPEIRAGGEVVIFTGVRIERMYDLAERLPKSRTGPGKRSGDAEVLLR